MLPCRYWIVGPGRLGLSIGALLGERGVASEIVVVGRSPGAPDHPLFELSLTRYTRNLERPLRDGRLLITVPDGAIGQVAEELAGLGRAERGAVALHFSGALSAEALSSLARAGYATGSLHPLSTVADVEFGAERLRGAFFGFEGEASAREAALAIVAAADGRLLDLHAANKTRYHAACVFASNYVVTCAAVAVQLLASAAEISEAEATRALRPLWEGAVTNLAALGLPEALTGPISRGDVVTVQRHLSELEPPIDELYAELALRALDVSREQGLAPEVAAEIESAIRLSESGGPR